MASAKKRRLGGCKKEKGGIYMYIYLLHITMIFKLKQKKIKNKIKGREKKGKKETVY